MNTDPRTLTVGEPLTCRIAMGSQVVSFDTFVRHVDTRGLFFDRPTGIADKLLPGVEVLVRYVRKDSAYQFLTVVLEQEPDQPEDADEDDLDAEEKPVIDLKHLPVLVRFPGRITRYQRRAYDRSQVEGVVRYRAGEDDIRTYRGYILDLSAGGVRFATRQVGFLEEGKNPVGMRLKVSLLLSRGTEFHDIPSEIRRVTLDKNNVEDDYLIVQVAFRDIDSKLQDKLDMWVKRLRRSQKPGS
ncbi:PilZ domain-containing protein [bacterium]|nr:PilZ domain-containing protein [bacterium]